MQPPSGLVCGFFSHAVFFRSFFPNRKRCRYKVNAYLVPAKTKKG